MQQAIGATGPAQPGPVSAPGEPPGTFGSLLRQCRAAAGLTQEELAQRSGLTARAIGDMERGRSTRPYPRSVRLLADALGLPEQARARLLTAAGADRHPRPAIQPEELERAGRAGVPAPPPTAVPRQLPAGVAHFSGREAELRALDRLLSEEGQPPGAVVISAIGGTAGIGKTALALHWAQLIAHLFPDGQLYASLRGFDPSGAPVAPKEVIRGFLAALGVRPERVPATMDDQVGLYRTLLAQRRVLVVLDNARDAEQVRPLLPTSPTCLAVVTSRSDLAGLVATAGARPLILDVPSTAEARQLLAGVLGPARVAGEAGAAAALVRLCARLPLALAIVGARGAAAPGLRLAALAAELANAEGRLDVLETGDPLSSVRAVFSWSCRYLSDPAARLFRLTGVHPGPDITAPAAASLAGISAPAARRALAELTRSHLLSEHSPGRFAFHDLLRVYAAEQARDLDDETARQAAGRRVLDHYLHTAYAAALLLRPLRAPIVPDPPQPGCTPEALGSSDQALAWFEAERQVLLTLTAHAAATGLDSYAWQIPWTLTDFLDRRGHWQDMVSALQTARAAAERLEDLDAQARTCHSLGRALLRTASAADAETQYRRALVLAGQVGDQVGMASAHIGLTRVCDLQGKLRDALANSEQALDLYRSAGHRGGQANALNGMGWCHARLGNNQQALAACRESITLMREVNDGHGEAYAWGSLGFAHHAAGQHAEAVTCYRRSLDICSAVSDRYLEADTLRLLGDTQQARGHRQSARAAWRKALAIMDELGDDHADELRGKLDDLPKLVKRA